MFQVWSEQGPRSYQEDSYMTFQSENVCAMAVFDGHGASRVSNFLAQSFARRMSYIANEDPPSTLDEWKEALRDLFHWVNKDMRDALRPLHYTRMGSTATMALVVTVDGQRHVWVANAGDSRTFVYATNTNKVPLFSTCHRPEDPDEARRVCAAGAFIVKDRSGVLRVNGNLATTRSFGDDDLGPGVIICDPEVLGPWTLPPGETAYMVCASDGLFDVMHISNMWEIVSKAAQGSASHVLEALKKQAKQCGLVDNTTVLVARIGL